MIMDEDLETKPSHTFNSFKNSNRTESVDEDIRGQPNTLRIASFNKPNLVKRKSQFANCTK